jgi:two-component system, NarL family, sensor kinase
VPSTLGRSFLRHPVLVFLAVSLVLVAGIFLATNELTGRAAEQAAVEQAESVNEFIADTAVDPYLRTGLLDGRAGAVDRFVRRGLEVQTEELVGFDIITTSGRVAYDSTNVSVAAGNDVYPLSQKQQRVLSEGGTDSEVADPDSARHQARAGDETGLVKIYTQVQATTSRNAIRRAERAGVPLSTEPALFVAYWDLEGVEERRERIFGSFRWITLGPLLLLTVISTVMLGLLTGQLRRGSRERERLLQTAIDASDAERRRIARDLHDGVVQDLAGSAFALSGAARDPATTPQTAEVLANVSSSMRDSLKQMRSLLAEIHPPELHGRGLETALEDLIAPAAAAGIHASVSVSGIEGASDPEVALVWRVAQEAVRNATRHSGASTLAVTVRGDAEQLLLEVVDDGVGFDTSAPSEPDRFGLRGLRSLVRDVGGELDVTSAVGEGTSVRMAVRR